MKTMCTFAFMLVLAIAGPANTCAATGEVKGVFEYSLPPWFKSSFLDFPMEAGEALEQGKHLMVFIHLDNCPYCARMLQESFTRGDNRDFMEENFDVVGINIEGSLDLTWTGGARYTEKSLAKDLEVFATPTIIFLDPDGGEVLRLTGYRDPPTLRIALDYVNSGSYDSQSFSSYQAALVKPVVYTLRDHPKFSTVTNFQGYTKPLAVLFEDKQCTQCSRFHDKTLNNPEVLEEMDKFQFVRLDTDSNQTVVDIDGNQTTPAQWAKSLDLTYRPAIVLFNEGREIYHTDKLLYHFHFSEMLRYVSGALYEQYDSVSTYSHIHRAELLDRGIDVDFGE